MRTTERLTLDTLVKVLGPGGESHHGGSGEWHLANGRPGKWMPAIKNPALCSRGYHVVSVNQLIPWLGPTLWRVEVRGKRIDDEEKSVVEQARLLSRIETWNDRTARLFACDCAERVLRYFEAELPEDGRPRAAIRAARDYANGILGDKHLDDARVAAWVAAWAAASTAASTAAWAAACAAAMDAAMDAARDAACAAMSAAAWAAASDAAWAAAWAAEGEWLTARLLQYLNGEVE